MHFPIKVIRQPPIIVQSTQIRATHITNLQFLVTRRPGGVREGFQLSFFFFFGRFGGADFVVFVNGECDGGGFAEDGDFEESGINGVGEVGYLF